MRYSIGQNGYGHILKEGTSGRHKPTCQPRGNHEVAKRKSNIYNEKVKKKKICTLLKMVGTCVYCGETRKENSDEGRTFHK